MSKDDFDRLIEEAGMSRDDLIRLAKDVEMKKSTEPLAYIEALAVYVTRPYPQFGIVQVVNIRATNLRDTILHDEAALRKNAHKMATAMGYDVPVDCASSGDIRAYLVANIDVETGGYTIILLERGVGS
jgi:hypothetical protein